MGILILIIKVVSFPDANKTNKLFCLQRIELCVVGRPPPLLLGHIPSCPKVQ